MKMRNIILILILLKPIVGFSQDTTGLTGNDSILRILLEENYRKGDSLQKLIDSIDKKIDSVYLSITNQFEIIDNEFDYQDIIHAKNEFDKQYHGLIKSNEIPTDLPIENIQNNSIVGFGQKIHPIYKIRKFHNGIDIPADKGTTVKTTISGKVEMIKKSHSGHGKHLIVKSDKNVKVLFAHLDTIFVSIGNDLKKGDIIGKVGNTGLSIKNHLHYEILINEKPINPVFATFEKFSENNLRHIFTQNKMSLD